MEKKKYRIDERRSKRGMIVRSYWSDVIPESYNLGGFSTVYEKRGKRMYKVMDNGGRKYFKTVGLGYVQEVPREIERIPESWQQLWHEIQVWYGDIRCSESPEQFLTRMMEVFKLTKIKK